MQGQTSGVDDSRMNDLHKCNRLMEVGYADDTQKMMATSMDLTYTIVTIFRSN